MCDLILASASPRRRDLLHAAGLSFDTRPTDIDESQLGGEAARDYAQRMAQEKAMALDEHDRWILGADTVVHDRDQVLGKPQDADDARRMLRRLADRWHTVTTAFCLTRDAVVLASECVETRVRFRALSDADIDRYLARDEAMDKAGAYGIQGAGGSLVDCVEGSYTNVVGLPLPQVLSCLARCGVQP